MGKLSFYLGPETNPFLKIEINHWGLLTLFLIGVVIIVIRNYGDKIKE